MIGLKGEMLATLLHEVAHHQDWMMRVARGRWRMDDATQREIYAEKVAGEWWQSCVVDYRLEAARESRRSSEID